VTSTWVERRVGSRGRTRVAVMRKVLDNVHLSERVPLGFDEVQLERLAARHDFDRLARLIPDRGDAHRLREIAWFGSAVADIASSGTGAARANLVAHDAAIESGALFNLAVALVDSVVDGHRDERAANLRASLAPEALRSRLVNGAALNTDGAAGAVIAVFDAVLADVRERWHDDLRLLAAAAALLRRMYVSEMQPGASRRDAKMLPLVFIGLVSDPVGRPAVQATVEGIGALAALLDDWQDLGDDICAGRGNVFVHERDVSRTTGAGRALTGVRLVARPRRTCGVVAGEIRAALDATLDAARRTSSDVEAKVHAFLRRLLMP
jgi:hypothetical protein